MARHNNQFAKPAFDARDLHRPLSEQDDLKAVMVWQEWRSVTSSLTLHCNKAMFILEATEISRPLAGKQVEFCEYSDVSLEIRHGEHALPYRVFDKIRQVSQASIVENKHLDAALVMAELMQEMLPARKRNNNEPGRRSQGPGVFTKPAEHAVPQVKRKLGRPPLQQLTSVEKAQRALEPA